MSDTIFQAAALIVPLIFAIVFHEVAHGWVARALGDPTAHEMKRLSLNPLRHVDPMGTIILPGFNIRRDFSIASPLTVPSTAS